MSVEDFTQTIQDFGFQHLIDVGLVAYNRVEWTAPVNSLPALEC